MYDVVFIHKNKVKIFVKKKMVIKTRYVQSHALSVWLYTRTFLCFRIILEVRGLDVLVELSFTKILKFTKCLEKLESFFCEKLLNKMFNI